MSDTVDVEAIVTAIKSSRKYGDTHEATIRELVAEEAGHYKKAKDVEKAARKRLHSIMAPYLGDPDYEEAKERLTAVFASNDDTQIHDTLLDLLHTHLSTRERLPILDDFYREIFAVTGRPRSILDVACGLNPLALRWMFPVVGDPYSLSGDRYGDGESLRYYAYDIHEPRIEFINHYFALEGLPQLAKVQDIALRFPQETADLALFLKEMPRFARNYGDLGPSLLESLQVRWLVVSFPTVSAHGGRDLTDRYRHFFYELIAGHDWPVTELLFESELVMIASKRES